MFPRKNESKFTNNNNIYDIGNNNEFLNANKISTNRLINESLSLNSKVEQYRQALSMASININNGNFLNDNNRINNYNNNNIMFGSKNQNPINNSIFQPKYNINTLGSLSKEFISISKKPEEFKELLNQKNNIEMQNTLNNNFNQNKTINPNLFNRNFFINLRQSYENHINDLYTNFKLCLNKLEEIACIYGNKINSNMIKDVIDDNLFYQKENQIQNFINEISELKTQKEKNNEDEINNLKKSYEIEFNKEKENNNKIIKDLNNNLISYEEQNSELNKKVEKNNNEIDRLQKVISVMEIDLNENDRILKDKIKENEELKSNFSNIQNELLDMSIKNKKMSEENKSLHSLLDQYELEKKDIINNKYNRNYNYNTENNIDNYNNINNINYRTFSKNMKESSELYEKKIKELSQINNRLEDELNTTRRESDTTNSKYTQVLGDMQNKLKILTEEWNKKFQSDKNNYENIIFNLEEKFKNEIDNLNENHNKEIESLKNNISLLKQRDDLLNNFEKNYIKISEHEKIINDLVKERKEKLEKEFIDKKNSIEEEYKNKLNKMENEKKMEYEFLTENIKNNLIKEQNYNNELKNKILLAENKNNSLILENKNYLEEINRNKNMLNNMDKVINDSKEKLNLKENEYEILINEKNKLIKEIADLKGKEININKNEIALKKEINNSNLLKNKISELNNNINELNEKIITLEKKNLEYKLNLENNTNSNIRLINNIKNMKKEINNIKNDFIKNFNNLKTKNDETIILLISKIKNYENNYQMKLIDIEKKYQKHLSEQIRINTKLERENKDLISEKNNNNLKSRDLLFKKLELENEIKNYIGLNEKLKAELDNRNNESELIFNKNKLLIKTYTNNINNLLLMMNKLKKKYQSDIYLLKSQINNMIQLFQNNIIKKGLDIKSNINNMKNIINQLNTNNKKYKENINNLKLELKRKEDDSFKLKDALNKLQISYDELCEKLGSEKIINGKVEKEKMRIKDNINSNQNK